MTKIQILLLTASGLLVGGGVWFGLLYLSRAGKLCNRQLLPLVLAVGFILRIAFVIGTPAFYAPDEQSHYKYIRFVAEHRSLPIQTSKTGAVTNDWEYYQPPLYYMTQIPVYLLSTAMFQNEDYVVRALRLFTVVFWIGTVWLAFRFLRILEIENEILRLVVICMVCLLPTYTYLSSMINNDNMTTCMCALLLCSIAGGKWTRSGAVLTGIILGLALLTKLSAVVCCPAIVMLSGLEAVRERANRRSAIVSLVIVVTVSAVIWIPWAARNLYLYDDITAETVVNVKYLWPTMADGVISSARFMTKTFWAVSGIRNNVDFHFSKVGILLSFFTLSGLLYTTLSKERRNAVFPSELDGGFWVIMALSIGINVLLILRFGILYGQGQGRFLFPLLLPVSLFIGIGLRSYPIKNLGVHITGFFITYALMFTLFSLGYFTRIGRKFNWIVQSY